MFEDGSPRIDPEILNPGVPVLGICYGMRLVCQHLGEDHAGRPSRVRARQSGDQGRQRSVRRGAQRTTVWMSHGDRVTDLASEHRDDRINADLPAGGRPVQRERRAVLRRAVPPRGHAHTHGSDIIRNFAYNICGCTGTGIWPSSPRPRSAASASVSAATASSADSRAAWTRPSWRLSCTKPSGITTRFRRQRLAPQRNATVETTFRDHFNVDLRVMDATEQFHADRLA